MTEVVLLPDVSLDEIGAPLVVRLTMTLTKVANFGGGSLGSGTALAALNAVRVSGSRCDDTGDGYQGTTIPKSDECASRECI